MISSLVDTVWSISIDDHDGLEVNRVVSMTSDRRGVTMVLEGRVSSFEVDAIDLTKTSKSLDAAVKQAGERENPKSVRIGTNDSEFFGFHVVSVTVYPRRDDGRDPGFWGGPKFRMTIRKEHTQ